MGGPDVLSIKDNIDEIERSLSDFARNQLPFALAMTLNDTAADAKIAEDRAIERDLDQPTPFTKRANYVRRASKRKLVSEVGVKTVQARYLGYQARGGVRTPKGRALVIPVNQRKNRYGNMPKGAVKRLAAAKNVFVAGRGKKRAGHLRPGIYKRTGRGGKDLKLMVAFEDRARYTERLRYERTAQITGEAVVADHFARRFRQAIETAR